MAENSESSETPTADAVQEFLRENIAEADSVKEEAKFLCQQAEQIRKDIIQRGLLKMDKKELESRGFELEGTSEDFTFDVNYDPSEEPDLPRLTIENRVVNRINFGFESGDRKQSQKARFNIGIDADGHGEDKYILKMFFIGADGEWEIDTENALNPDEQGNYIYTNSKKPEPGEVEQAGLALQIYKRILDKAFPPR